MASTASFWSPILDRRSRRWQPGPPTPEPGYPSGELGATRSGGSPVSSRASRIPWASSPNSSWVSSSSSSPNGLHHGRGLQVFVADENESWSHHRSSAGGRRLPSASIGHLPRQFLLTLGLLPLGSSPQTSFCATLAPFKRRCVPFEHRARTAPRLEEEWPG